MDHTPRFVTCTKHDPQLGNIKEYTWDKKKISVNPALADDTLMLQNVFEAKIISSTIYPLIFETKAPLNKEITLRSLEFYKEVQQDHDLYKRLSSEEKTHFLIGVRDLFVASCRNLLSEEEKQVLKDIVDLIDPFDSDPDIVTKNVASIDVTPYPTSKNKMVKFIDISSQETLLDECFIRNELNLLIAFVDPQDLSYHNFENIVNLDSLFDDNFDKFKITNMQKFKEHDVFTFDMIDRSGILKALDKCGLYVQPLNKVSRGGERFIFSSEILSKSLSECIVKYMKHPKLTNKKFRLVNYVFRYNKFRPGDKKFICHYDTPYHDPSRKHHSKYTLLLYLTSGSADPVLSFDNDKLQIKSIDTKGEIKGIIFDQKYEHEGKAYLEGDKTFIRSELIYEYDVQDFTIDNEVSKRFNIGCYMTKQSLFNPEVEQYASDMFNQAAKARVSIAATFNTKEILLYKRYQNTPFITNGYDYWFKKDTTLKAAARFAILDHFNCKLDTDKAFNKLVYQEVIKIDLPDINNIFSYLENYQKGVNGKRALPPIERAPQEQKPQGRTEGVIAEPLLTKKIKTVETTLSLHDKLSYQNAQKNKKTEIQKFDSDLDQEEEDKVPDSDDNDDDDDSLFDEEASIEISDNGDDEVEEESEQLFGWLGLGGLARRKRNCCFKHAGGSFNSLKCASLKEFKGKLKAVQTKKKNDLQKQYTIMVMDKKVQLPDENIVVQDDFISFNVNIWGFNFAASDYSDSLEDLKERNYDTCWIYGEYKRSDFVVSRDKKVSLYKGLPSIPYRILDQGYHLRLELFQNNLIRKAEDTLKEYFIIQDPSRPKIKETIETEKDDQEQPEENNFEEI